MRRILFMRNKIRFMRISSTYARNISSMPKLKTIIILLLLLGNKQNWSLALRKQVIAGGVKEITMLFLSYNRSFR